MAQDRFDSLDYSVLQQCLHCGMCLPSCPTYSKTQRERHSPRGRIALMRAVADGELAATPEFSREMDFCLGCLACTSACPAGVDYGPLIETARAHAASENRPTPRARFLRWFALRQLLARPRLLRAVGKLLWLWQATGLQETLRRSGLLRFFSRSLATLEEQTPRVRAQHSDELIAEIERPSAPPAHRTALLTGCVHDLLFPEVNRATADVLLENGCLVRTPRAQPCCGSLHAHNGDLETARVLARRLIESVDADAVDAIVTNSAGCGSHLKQYDRLLAEDPAYAARARRWTAKVRDIHEWLAEIGLKPPAADCAKEPLVATYHDACHLCHGQKITAQPRALLRTMPGLELRECVESTWCCGSAGIYNLTHPETAAWLRERKLAHLRATGAGVVAAANPGCLLFLQNAAPPDMRFVHPIQLLAEAYRGRRNGPGGNRPAPGPTQIES